MVGRTASLEASATDLGGVKSVAFWVDDTLVKTATAAPYKASADMQRFGSGTHTLKALVTDMYGRVTAVTKSVRVDLTSPVLSGVSASATTFYPKKRDGYRDNLVVGSARTSRQRPH